MCRRDPIFKNKKVFIYFKSQEAEREGETEKHSQMLDHPQNSYGWIMRSQELHLGLYVGGKGPIMWVICCCLARHISRKLDPRQGRAARTPKDPPIWNVISRSHITLKIAGIWCRRRQHRVVVKSLYSTTNDCNNTLYHLREDVCNIWASFPTSLKWLASKLKLKENIYLFISAASISACTCSGTNSQCSN